MDIVLRSAVIFMALFVVTRSVGRRELSMNEPFDLILLVVLGDLVQQGVTQSDYSIVGTLLAVCTFALMTVLVSFVSFRVRPLRKVFEGYPIILIENGKVIEPNLRSQRLALDEVLSEARAQQIITIRDIRWAILETNGSISIIPSE